jgi:hypothetical protein
MRWSVAGGTLALALLVLPAGAQAKRRPLPVRPKLLQVSQTELLAGRVLPVRLTAGRAQRVRLTVRIRRGKRTAALIRPRTGRVARGQRDLKLRLSWRATRRLADCAPTRIIVTLTRGRARRSTSRTLHTEPPRCGRFFGAHAFWNRPLANGAPLDPNSASITNDLLHQVDANYRSGQVPTVNTTAYSAPVYTVPSWQPRVRVQVDQPPGLDRALERAFASVPIPPGARPAAGTDGWMVVWQPATDSLWEFWKARLAGDGWHARWGGSMAGVTHGPGFYTAPTANWGATATSLPLAGGLITASELRRGRIDHALAMAVPEPRGGAFARPAQRTDGFSSRATSVPEGARFRLDPKIDIDALNLSPAVRAIARAAQRYGMVVRDRGGVVALYAEDPIAMGVNPYPELFGPGGAGQALRSFPWWGLRLTRMHLVKSSGPLWPPCLVVCP